MTTEPRTTLLTAQDVASLLAVKPSWVYARSRDGGIPTVKLGRYCRYRRDEIERWIGAQGSLAV